MNNPTYSQIVSLYFQSFCRKDCASLEVLFSDNVTLTDWSVQIIGRDNLLAFNQKFFDTVKTLRVEVEKIALGQDTVIAEIRVVIDDKISAQVVDVFDFDQDNKIQHIRAYKR
jgi:ketosteroid isomerase-like protein